MKEEKVLEDAVACFLRKERKVLLAVKSRHIGEGCWNAHGGGVEPNEKPVNAAVRELFEESGGVMAKPENLSKIAEITFHNTKSDGSVFSCKVHFFEVWEWEGEPNETAEMLNPTWFEIDALPFHEMMPADRIWLPVALSGKKIKANPHLGPFQKELLGDFEIIEVTSFEE